MKKKIMTMLIAAICFSTAHLNCMATVSAAEEETEDTFLMGDINDDKSFNVADIVLLQKWLMADSDTYMNNWKAADFYKDDQLNVLDLVLMKRVLIEEMNGSPELEYPEIQEILFGNNDLGSGNSKPMSELRIAMKCKAFCPLDKVLTVDVAMLGFSQPQHYEENGYVYEYSIEPYENWKPIEDARLIVNGEIGRYKEEYAGKDREIFKVGVEYDDYETYHHENASLDFHNYPAGSSGCIRFNFKALFLNEDGTRPEQPQSEGCGHSLYFYVGEDGVGISNASVEEAEKQYQTKGTVEVTPSDQYTGRWHGKYISRELYEALKVSDSETIPVKVSFKDTGSNEFVYQGRTLEEYTRDLYGEDISKLEELLEQGDVIKYGEVCYTTGTPDGKKWTKALYDIRVEFYGEELLSKYIVNGEFLKEQLQADLAELKEYYRAALDEAVEAFYQARIGETIELLETEGIKSERIDDTHYMLMFVTAAEFETLSLENASYYYLYIS